MSANDEPPKMFTIGAIEIALTLKFKVRVYNRCMSVVLNLIKV